MRQNRMFPPERSRLQPAPEPPSRRAVLRQHLKRFYLRSRNILLVGAGILIALAAMFLYDKTQPPPQHLTQRDINAAVVRALEAIPPKPSYASQVYETIRPSLVQVRAVVLGRDGKTDDTLGAGIVIDDTGNILTSLHIVDDALEVIVTFADKTESEALVVMGIPENDLAVLRPQVVPDDLVPATLASSSMLRVGDEVFAVGNPFGISNSLSAGVVSGLGRSFNSPRAGETLTNLIQFDAAVNPGNSGGPLLNRDGEVVGIVTALLNPTDQDFFIGIGFAVTMESAGAALGSPPY